MNRLFLTLILVPLFAHAEEPKHWDYVTGVPRPIYSISIGRPSDPTFTFIGQSGKAMFTITPDGHITMGPGMKADEAARTFIAAMQIELVKCKKP